MGKINTDDKNNQIINTPDLSSIKLDFVGRNNILYFENSDIRMDGVITFKGDNSIFAIKSSKDVLKLNVTIYNDSTVYLGSNCSMNNKLEIIASEAKNVIIGDEGLFSSQCLIRTSDAHRIYSIDTLSRVNDGKSVCIGDHVWLSARVVVLKGSHIHSGSIIGSDAVVTGKEIKSNTIWAGNPAREVKRNILFDKTGTHGLTSANSSEAAKIDTNKSSHYIFSYNADQHVDFDSIEEKLGKLQDPHERLLALLKIMCNENQNRFAL